MADDKDKKIGEVPHLEKVTGEEKIPVSADGQPAYIEVKQITEKAGADNAPDWNAKEKEKGYIRNKPEIVQEEGDSEAEIMSQKAVTEALKKLRNAMKWRRLSSEDKNTIHLVGTFASGTPEAERYVWINGTKHTLEEEFDFTLEDVVWKFGEVLDGVNRWFGNGLKTLTAAHGMDEIENAKDMFYGCNKLDDISGLSDWDTTKLKNIFEMFRGCSVLSDLSPLAKWQTPNLENMDSVFRVCTGLTDISPIANWDISAVTTFHMTFQGCTAIKNIDCLKQWTPSAATTLERMFYDCRAIENVDLGGWDIDSVEGTQNMFTRCSSLKTLSLKNAKVARLGGESVTEMFSECPKLTSVDLGGWERVRSKSYNGMLQNIGSKVTVDVSGWTFRENEAGLSNKFLNWQDVIEFIGLDTFDTSLNTRCNYTFEYCNSITELDLTSWSFDSCTELVEFAQGCSKLKTIKFGTIDLNVATDISNMFKGCGSLTTVTGQISNIPNDMNLKDSPLANESAMVFINGLKEGVIGKTITFSSTTYDTLTPEQIAVATAKGWNVAKA